MIKHALEQIASVETYGIVSLLIFFTFFSAMLAWVWCLNPKTLDHLSQLPTQPEISDKPNNE